MERAFASDVRFEGQGDDGLQEGREQKGPRPGCIWPIHPARAPREGGTG